MASHQSYMMFWADIGNSMYNSTFILAFERGELSDSQQQGVITLIPKQE